MPKQGLQIGPCRGSVWCMPGIARVWAYYCNGAGRLVVEHLASTLADVRPGYYGGTHPRADR